MALQAGNAAEESEYLIDGGGQERAADAHGHQRPEDEHAVALIIAPDWLCRSE